MKHNKSETGYKLVPNNAHNFLSSSTSYIHMLPPKPAALSNAESRPVTYVTYEYLYLPTYLAQPIPITKHYFSTVHRLV